MGQKVTDQVAEMRSLPAGIDQRSPARHPDWLGPDDLALKIEEIREATNWEIPIQLKLGAARVYDDVRMAVKCGPDSIYIDGMEGGTGAGPHIAAEDTGVPGIAAIRQARRAIDELGKRGEITLVYAGGIRNGGDVAKALALGADAIAIGHSVLMALNCNKHIEGVTDYEAEIGVPAGYCYHCHTGRCPVGVTTQDPELRKRLDPDEAAERVYNFLHTLTMEAQMLARACGKTNIHSLEPEDLAALTMEASAMAQVPLAGTDYTVGVAELSPHRLRAGTTMAGKGGYKGTEGQGDVDKFLKDAAGLDSSREQEIGQHIGYRYDVNLVPDYEKLTPYLKDYMEFMGWDDLNWLEDVHMGYEEGLPAIFDRNINGWVRIPPTITLPDNQQDRDMLARELLVRFQTSPNHPLCELNAAYRKF